jgi:two-component system, sensor histidine kinase
MREAGGRGLVLEDYASDPSGRVRSELTIRPLLVIVAYLLTGLFFAVTLALPSERPNESTILIVTYSHISTTVLAVGLAFLPSRLIWVAFIAFTGCFLVVETIALSWTGILGWSAMSMVRGLVVAGTVGVLGGLSARLALGRYLAGDKFYTPERAALFGALGLTFAGIVLGGFAMWVDATTHQEPLRIDYMFFQLSQRMLQLGLCTAGGILLFIAPEEKKNLLEIALHMALFAVLGWLYNQEVFLAPGVDVTIVALPLLLFRPIYTAIAGVLGGICVFILLTGMFVDLPVSLPLERLRNDGLTNVMFAMLIMVALQRVSSSRRARVQMQTLGRMTRAQELARFGYYTFEFRVDRIQFDPLAQRILGITSPILSSAFVERVHPDDRDTVTLSATTATEEGQSFSFRFSTDGPWHDGCTQRHFTGFSRFELNSAGKPKLSYGIVVDVTQEHAQEEHLRFVLAELSERQGQQTQMFSMISHELRTPAAIMSMIADEMDDGKAWQEKGPQMRAVLDQLLSILSDMRQTVRPEQNLPIRLEAFRPRDLAIGVQDAFRPMAATRGIQITLDLSASADEMRGTDRVRLNQTLSNLVKNAILHSQATEIILGYHETAGMVGHWVVSDNGRNIPKAQRERLFQPFVRNANTGTKADGSGLGLYIAKGAIELLGGTIDYIERPMSGAEFQVILPMTLPKQPGETLLANRKLICPKLDHLSVLVVEDSETMGGLLVARLSKIFGDVKWVRDGISGLAWTNLHKPDVVISDLFMPGLGGDEMAKKLRAGGYDRPIIGMTATDIGEEVDRFRKCGADAVITKPLRPADLENALASLL